MIGLIPCRAGSKRIPNKNLSLLGGKPLLAWTIDLAQACDLFKRVIVSTDSDQIAELAKALDAEVIMRPAELALDTSPDIEWVNHVFAQVEANCFSILRPTSPFRTVEMIERAQELFFSHDPLYWDSLRAVEPVRQHPQKMWIVQDNLVPLYDEWTRKPAPRQWWNQPTQTLSDVYVQNASLEMAWSHVLPHSISGRRIIPFVTEGIEGFDINYPEDLVVAEHLLKVKV